MSTVPLSKSKTVSERRNVAVSFAPMLDSGELLTGTPTIVEVTTSALTLSNKRVSTGALTIEGVPVLTGQAVQFDVSGGLAGANYTIRITTISDATPQAQTIITNITLEVEAD
jgi:hypothetical protein